MISKLLVENISKIFSKNFLQNRFFNPPQILEFRQNDQPAETILNAIKILLPSIKENERMTIAQKVDALEAIGNILIGVFENTDENYVFDETSRLGKISIRCSNSHVPSLTS